MLESGVITKITTNSNGGNKKYIIVLWLYVQAVPS